MSNSITNNGNSASTGGKRPYKTPTLLRVELAIDETLGAGCKLAGATCEGPPITSYNAGS